MKIYHYHDPTSSNVKVAFVADEHRIREAYNFADKSLYEITPGTELPSECFMEIPEHVWKSFLKGFAELANEEGVKLESDLKREGQLEATKYHLEDLRSLLKLNK